MPLMFLLDGLLTWYLGVPVFCTAFFALDLYKDYTRLVLYMLFIDFLIDPVVPLGMVGCAVMLVNLSLKWAQNYFMLNEAALFRVSLLVTSMLFWMLMGHSFVGVVVTALSLLASLCAYKKSSFQS